MKEQDLPPVSAPEAMAFHGSSFFLMWASEQSKMEKNVPQIAKLPPSIGARALHLAIAWAIIWPLGAFRAPPTKCHIDPPNVPVLTNACF